MGANWERMLTVFLLGSIASAAIFGQAPRNPRVVIDSGVLEGVYLGTRENPVAFLGVPFAAPPVGRLRWQPPRRVVPWEGVRKAAGFGAACPQSPHGIARLTSLAHKYSEFILAYEPLHFSEDCLYLNVLTTNLAGKTKVPVMFWIHGGGEVEGTGALPPFSAALAREGVVLVSINYRLGALGLMAHPGLTAESPHHSSGNYAILDMIAALQWVHRNIAAFGGDPDNVTIFGHSSGSSYTCYLMATRLAQGLFHRVISESGECRDYLSPELTRPIRYEQGNGTAEDVGVRIGNALGIPDDSKAVSKLRAATPEEIIRAINERRSRNPDPGANLSPEVNVDGWVFTEQPAITFAAGRQAAVPLIVGSTANEYTILFDEATDPQNLGQYHAALELQFGADAAKVFAAYPATRDKDVRSVFSAMTTDLYGSGARMVAQDGVRAGAEVFLYLFTYPGKGKTIPFGAYHGSELKFISGMFDKETWGWPDAEDLRFGEIVRAYWVQFAKTGSPNRVGLPYWPAYGTATDQCLELGREIKSRASPHADKYVLFAENLKARLAAARLSAN